MVRIGNISNDTNISVYNTTAHTDESKCNTIFDALSEYNDLKMQEASRLNSLVNKPKLKEMIELANKYDVPITEDLWGNGVLGDTPCVLTEDCSEETRIIYEAILHIKETNPKLYKKLQDCITKDDKGQFTVQFAKRLQTFTCREKDLLSNYHLPDMPKGKYIPAFSKEVLGDADMAVLITAIRVRGHQPTRKMSIKHIETFIAGLFRP